MEVERVTETFKEGCQRTGDVTTNTKRNPYRSIFKSPPLPSLELPPPPSLELPPPPSLKLPPPLALPQFPSHINSGKQFPEMPIFPVLNNVHDRQEAWSMVGHSVPSPFSDAGYAANAQHMYSHHGQAHDAPAPPIDRPFKCDQCVQSFNRNHDLKRHKRIHLAVKPYPCEYCDKSFSRKEALKRHQLVKGCGGKKSVFQSELVDKNRVPDKVMNDQSLPSAVTGDRLTPPAPLRDTPVQSLYVPEISDLTMRETTACTNKPTRGRETQDFKHHTDEYMSNERGPNFAPGFDGVESACASKRESDSVLSDVVDAQSIESKEHHIEHPHLQLNASNHCPASTTERGSFQMSPSSGTDLESSMDTETEEDSNESEMLPPAVSDLIVALSCNLLERFFRRLSRQSLGIRQHVAEKRSRSDGAASKPSGSASHGAQGARKGNSNALNEDDDLDDGDEDLNEEPDRKRERLFGSPAHGGRLLACPYSKYDPTKYSERNHEDRAYRGCSSCLVRDIPKLKQHLKRVHRRPRVYCPRCYTAFKTRDESDAHLNMDQLCERRGVPYPEKMTEDQWKQVEKRRLGLGVVENWKLIFRLIFPSVSEADVPESPYVPASAQEMVSDFLCYFNREAPRLLMSEIQRRIDLPSLSGHENLMILNAALEQSVSNVIRRMAEGASNRSARTSELSVAEDDRSSSHISSETLLTPQLEQALIPEPPGILPSPQPLPPAPPSDLNNVTVENLLQDLESESAKLPNNDWDLPMPPLDNLEWAYLQMPNEHFFTGSDGENTRYSSVKVAGNNGITPAA